MLLVLHDVVVQFLLELHLALLLECSLSLLGATSENHGQSNGSVELVLWQFLLKLELARCQLLDEALLL